MVSYISRIYFFDLDSLLILPFLFKACQLKIKTVMDLSSRSDIRRYVPIRIRISTEKNFDVYNIFMNKKLASPAGQSWRKCTSVFEFVY